MLLPQQKTNFFCRFIFKLTSNPHKEKGTHFSDVRQINDGLFSGTRVLLWRVVIRARYFLIIRGNRKPPLKTLKNAPAGTKPNVTLKTASALRFVHFLASSHATIEPTITDRRMRVRGTVTVRLNFAETHTNYPLTAR